MMINPYRPADIESLSSAIGSRFNRYTFAGAWLAGAGLFHFIAINLISNHRTLVSLQWSPMLMIVLGWSVMYRFRVGIVITRLLGSITLLFLCLGFLLLLLGFDDVESVTYGSLQIMDPKPWHVVVMLLVVGATVLPSWWHLQRAIGEETGERVTTS